MGCSAESLSESPAQRTPPHAEQADWTLGPWPCQLLSDTKAQLPAPHADTPPVQGVPEARSSLHIRRVAIWKHKYRYTSMSISQRQNKLIF